MLHVRTVHAFWGRSIRACLYAGLIGLSGCVTLDSYPDPAYTRYSLTDHPPGSLPPSLGLNVTYHMNGEPDPGEAARARQRIAYLLSRSGLSQVALPGQADASLPRLELHIDQRYDAEQARQAGLSTGASLGGHDNRVRDELSIAIKLEEPGQQGTGPVGIYEHAILTDIEDLTLDVELVEYVDALDAVLDDALARFVADRQRATLRPSPIIVLPEAPDLSEDSEPDV